MMFLGVGVGKLKIIPNTVVRAEKHVFHRFIDKSEAIYATMKIVIQEIDSTIQETLCSKKIFCDMLLLKSNIREVQR